ncbi:MAG: hypothetical protein J6Q72_01050 [Clostridia bacterium]|nr:hypothetical protein [Clostridia bacterium]
MKRKLLVLLLALASILILLSSCSGEMFDDDSIVSDGISSDEISVESETENSDSATSQNHMVKIESDDEFFQSTEYFYLMYTAFDFYKAYMTADLNMAKSLMVSDDLECLAQFPTGETYYGNLDDVDNYYIDNLSYKYDENQKIKTASIEIPLEKDDQFDYMMISFEYIDAKDESGNTFKMWKVTDFDFTT